MLVAARNRTRGIGKVCRGAPSGGIPAPDTPAHAECVASEVRGRQASGMDSCGIVSLDGFVLNSG
ncbi:MAG: hypothetical protein MUD08_00760 [Cytophagales bacterium]|nr:hypothetical protein [Cytophagales bacterium]